MLVNKSAEVCKITAVKRTLTDSGEHGGGEVEGAGEFPLNACLVWHRFDDHCGQYSKVLVGDIVFAFEHVFKCLQRYLLFVLVLGLERVKNRRANEQISERAHNERQRSNILTFHVALRVAW